MKTADILADAIAWRGCPEALTWLRDWPHETIGPDDPPADWAAWYGYRAGVWLDDDRWLPHAAELVAAICRSPSHAYHADREWPDGRWEAHAVEILTATKIQMPATAAQEEISDAQGRPIPGGHPTTGR